MGADLISYSVVLPQGKSGISLVGKLLAKLKEPSKFSRACYEEDIPGASAEDINFEFAADKDKVLAFIADTSSRDLGWVNEVIGGKKVTFYFAGELSWGDTPEGRGYEALRAIWRLGIAKEIQKRLK